MTGEVTGYPDIDAAALVIEENKTLREPPPSSSLVFGHSFADHMLSIQWSGASGWAAPRIQPYAPLTLDPSSVIFHYAPSLFEGMKAYKDVQGRIRLFRPDMNMKRMNTSAERLALPVSHAYELIIAKKGKLKALTHTSSSSLDIFWKGADEAHCQARRN